MALAKKIQKNQKFLYVQKHRILNQTLVELGCVSKEGGVWEEGEPMEPRILNISRTTKASNVTDKTNPYPIFHPSPPLFAYLIPRTMFTAAKNREILPIQWWYQFQYLLIFVSFCGRAKKAKTWKEKQTIFQICSTKTSNPYYDS